MTSREETTDDAAQMQIAESALLAPSTIDLADAGLTIAGPQEDDVAPRGRSVSTQFGNPVLVTVLVRLLKSAQEALAADRGQADQFIVRATALISAEVERRETAEHSLSGAFAHSHLTPWQTWRAIEFVEANLAATIRIEDLARVTRLSASYFSKAFRRDFGDSPYAYVVRRRIERAQEMMLLTDEPLASIAIACGLAHQCHLTRLFHRIVGMSPASWRRWRRSSRQ